MPTRPVSRRAEAERRVRCIGESLRNGQRIAAGVCQGS
jgi:hypothetical protein